MIDFHCHMLPGLDDGAGSVPEALAMARILADAGYRAVCCTTHGIRGVWDAPSAEVRQAVAGLQTELNLAGIDLELLPGREYYLDEFLLSGLDDPLLLPGGLLLVELPSRCDAERVRDTVFQLVRRKFTPLIAHPERSSLLGSRGRVESAGLFKAVRSLFAGRGRGEGGAPPELHSPLLCYLRDLGCAFQGNLGSFVGRYGEEVRQNARHLLQQGVYTHLGSDAHSPSGLAETVSSGLGEVERLTETKTLKTLTKGAYV